MSWFLLATCSALLSASAAVIQKKVLSRLHALEFSFLVSIVILFLSSFVLLSIDVTSISSSTFIILVVKSILGGLAFLLVMISLEHNQISSALPLLGTTPAVTALLAIPILGESLQQWEWLGIGLMVAGTYMLERRPEQMLFQPFKNIFLQRNHFYIFGAVGLFAISSIADKSLLSNYKTNPLIILFYQHLIYCLMFGSMVFIRRMSLSGLIQKGKNQFLFILFIAFLTIAYRFTQLGAAQLAPIALVLAVKRTSILYASFFGGKLFSDERLPQKLIGSALIIASGFLILRNVG
jgi:drug/metabolite transporter (DMT)-like permease